MIISGLTATIRELYYGIFFALMRFQISRILADKRHSFSLGIDNLEIAEIKADIYRAQTDITA